LDLSHNVLEELGDELGDLPSLLNLDISCNLLRALSRLPVCLLHFNAEKNRISEAVPMSMERLNTLQLSSNHFTSIPEFHCSHAVILLMQANKLTELNPERISSTTKRIDLTKNEISEFPVALCSLVGLQLLNLSVNRLRSIPPEISSLRITSLFLSENAISTLPALPPTVLSLTCVRCEFTKLPDAIFSLPRISHLDFSCNAIDDVPALPNCQTIILSLNLIHKLPVLPAVLSKLDVSCNLLTELALEGEFIAVHDLDISHNKIQRFTAPSLPVLSILKLTGNPLRMRFDLARFPALANLDIAGTRCRIIPRIPPRFKELCLSDEKVYTKLNTHLVRLYRYDSVVGYAETIGSRPSMEDALLIWRSFVPGLNVYGVIDGHGGSETASQAAYLIPEAFRNIPTKSLSEMSTVFRQVNAELQRCNVRDGATIVVALVGRTEIGVAHLGDSRAVIIKKDLSFLSLTVDHKATERSEIDLVKENRSFVEGSRTAGVLAVSRAIGDFGIPGVGRIPAMTQYMRQPDDYRLVLACDGVFDVIHNHELGKVIGHEQNMQRAAYLLRNVASARGSQDNISVVIVNLERNRRRSS
jgi:serine/threonine protein phosphatase PrpC/Leucine-rich repeat (LRR) protein